MNDNRYQEELLHQTPDVKLPPSNQSDLLDHHHFDDLFLKRYQFNIRVNFNRKKELKKEEQRRKMEEGTRLKELQKEDEHFHTNDKRSGLLYEKSTFMTIKKTFIFLIVMYVGTVRIF